MTKRKFSRKRGKRGKWRQQRLAVGTVAKIARDIAQSEDKKNMRKYVHETQIKSAGYVWNTPALLPPTNRWAIISGNTCSFANLSTLGQSLRLTEMVQQPAASQSMLELRIHGIQISGVLKCNAHMPVRVETRLIFIPNINSYTTSAVDYLTPRFTFFYKSGKGCGNILFQGYNRRALAAFDASGIPVKFQTLGRKVMYLRQATVNGTMTDGPNATNTLILSLPSVYRRFKINQYFKTPRRAFVRNSQLELSNGNYYFVYWSDAPTVSDTVSILADCLLRYSIKAPLKKDAPP